MTHHHSFKRDRMKKGIYVLPNLFTTANLFCGFYAAIAAMKGMYEIAAITILIAVVLDSLDGRIARMTHTTSKFGAEYDSLCDLVTFGVAPGLMVYSWSLSSYGKWGWLAAFLFAVCGALRLARFNVQIGIIDGRVFNGLPIPGGAAVVASGMLFYYSDYVGGQGTFTHPTVLIGVVALSLFMVSSIKYYSFKDLNVFSRKPFMSFVLIVLILVIVVAEPQVMLFTFAFGYSLSGPVWGLYGLIRRLLTDGKTKKVQCPDRPL
ncbi:MAG: CDP-diacylglycerol--serine O-phosphatidyltransferase [Deltaproteobacteria bacterium]|nr:CDP-diacylglycerol--serine O-phosphatidyltransferase [Deltaproteobacteria bacterium]